MPIDLDASYAGECVDRTKEVADKLRGGEAAHHGHIIVGNICVYEEKLTTPVPLKGNTDGKNCQHQVVMIAPGGSPNPRDFCVCDPTYDPPARDDPLSRLVSLGGYIRAYMALLDTEQVKPDVVFVNLRKRDNEGIIPRDVHLFFTPGGEPC